ncbi:MAG: glycosyltransferase [Phycisphaerae bacterium]|jgi:glycosyltransferase involved in cell wall biosynthesis
MQSWPITFSLPQGLTVNGVTTWVLRVAAALAERGHEVRLVVHAAQQGHRSFDAERLELGRNVRVIAAPDLYDAGTWDSCLRIYSDLLPTVLQPNVIAESFAVAAALAVARADELRVVGWSHIDDAYDFTCLSYYEPVIHRFGAVSRHCAAALAGRIPTRAADIEHVPNGVAVPEERPRRALADRALRLIYAGRMDQDQKRVFDLVALAVELDRRGLRFEMRLVGDGPQADELRERIAAAAGAFRDRRNVLRLERPVPLERMPGVWSWADVSVLASNREGFSLSMVESMACGCVPVVTRVDSGVGEVLVEGQNGLTFPVGDVPAAAECVLRLARDEDALRGMSAAARAAVQAYCPFDGFVTQVASVFERAVAAAPRPWSAARPLRMNAPDAGAGGTIPSDAAARLRGVLQAIAADGGGPVAIYGAGNHTRALAAVWADSPVEVVAVIDDEGVLRGRRLWGWPIVSPEEAARLGARAVVISSWMHEEEICQRRGPALSAAGLSVCRLYAPTAEPAVT